MSQEPQLSSNTPSPHPEKNHNKGVLTFLVYIRSILKIDNVFFLPCGPGDAGSWRSQRGHHEPPWTPHAVSAEPSLYDQWAHAICYLSEEEGVALLPTRSEEHEVLQTGSVQVAILLSCQFLFNTA